MVIMRLCMLGEIGKDILIWRLHVVRLAPSHTHLTVNTKPPIGSQNQRVRHTSIPTGVFRTMKGCLFVSFEKYFIFCLYTQVDL